MLHFRHPDKRFPTGSETRKRNTCTFTRFTVANCQICHFPQITRQLKFYDSYEKKILQVSVQFDSISIKIIVTTRMSLLIYYRNYTFLQMSGHNAIKIWAMLPDRNFLYYNFGFGGFIFFLPAQLAHGPQSKYITAQIRPKSDNNHRSFNIRWNFS